MLQMRAGVTSKLLIIERSKHVIILITSNDQIHGQKELDL